MFWSTLSKCFHRRLPQCLNRRLPQCFNRRYPKCFHWRLPEYFNRRYPKIIITSESIDVETRDLLQLWLGFQPDNDGQAKVMIRARVFEQYVKYTNDTIKNAELLSQLRFFEGCKSLFNKNTLWNLEIFSKIHHWLQNQGKKQNPETQTNTRVPIKVAHTVYCCATRMAERSAAVDIIKNVLKELR